MSFWKRDEATRLRQDLDNCEKNARLVVRPSRRQRMIQAIHQAQSALDQNNIQQAKSCLYEAGHQFLLARYEGQVIFYGTATASLVSLLYLLVFVAVAAWAIWYVPIRENVQVFPIVLTSVSGGIGGVTAVMSNLVGIQLETQAITTRKTWYVVKPMLGAIMGLATYFALVTGISILSGTFHIENMPAVCLVAFLGGYLESFSTRVLNELADRLASRKEPHPVEVAEQIEEETASDNQG